MRCLHHPFVLVSWFRGFVRRRPSIVFVVVFIEVGFWCGGARVSSSSGLLLLLLFRQVSRDRDGLDDGFLRPRRRRCLHPRLRVRFGRKALRRHRSRIEKERKKKKKRFFGVVRTDTVRSLYASHSKRKEDDTQKARCCSSKRGKRRGEKCNKMCLDILPCATRQDTRALARCTRPRCRTPRRFDRARPRSTCFSSSSSFRRRRLLLERSTTLEWCEY